MTANTGYFTDAFGGYRAETHGPVLQAAQFVQVPAARRIAFGVASLKRVPEHLAQGGGIRPQGGLNAGGQGIRGQTGELFQQARAGPVKPYALIENHRNTGKTKHGQAAHIPYARHAHQGGAERVGDLVFHVLGRTAGTFGKNDLLVFTQLGDVCHRPRWGDPSRGTAEWW